MMIMKLWTWKRNVIRREEGRRGKGGFGIHVHSYSDEVALGRPETVVACAITSDNTMEFNKKNHSRVEQRNAMPLAVNKRP